MALSVKMANTPHEFEQIHRLNYQTFVEEIPQHVDKINDESRLIDKFHHKNTYFIVKEEDEVVAMVSYNDERPFSLDAKMPQLNQYLDADIIAPCEIRLLAVKKAYRHRKEIIIYLLDACIEFAFAVKANDCALVTGYTKQISLYKTLGFHPIGPIVISGGAEFQAMRLKLAELPLNSVLGRFIEKRQEKKQPSYFLTGPVVPFYGVDTAAESPAISHRSAAFVEFFHETCDKLKRLVKAEYVHITMGNGSLANAIIAAQLASMATPGVILSNGEFSERLVDHAERANLTFKQINKPWGEGFSMAEIERLLEENPEIDWLWTTHCETSTGMLNDIDALKNLCQRHQVKLVLDCMSSIGTLPVDLSSVYFASCSSAKALGAKTGLAFVFYNHSINTPSRNVPAVFDLGFSQLKNGIPFTISSHQIAALNQALSWFDNVGVWKRIKVFSHIVRQGLLSYGIVPLLDEEQSSPAIITLCVPKSINSYILGEQFAEKGVLLNYGSDYLRARNWLQISLMGHFYYRDIVKLLRSFELFAELAEEVPACSLSA